MSEEKDLSGLARYATSPPTASLSPASPFAALPSSKASQAPLSSGASSIANFEGPQPFWEPDYPSQRFRPEEYEAEDPEQHFSPTASLGERISQHISPDNSSLGGPTADLSHSMASSAKNPGEEMKPSVFVPAYKGLNFTPHCSLTTYGAMADRSKLRDASLGGVYTLMNSTKGPNDCVERAPGDEIVQASASHRMVRKTSKQTEGEKSRLSSEMEIHPGGGVRVDAFDGDIPTMSEHQQKSFEDLEIEQGIIEWNNSVFDERWLDPSSPKVEKPGDPPRPTPTGMITGKQIELASSRHQRWISFLRDLEETRKKMDLSARFKPDPLVWGTMDRSPSPERILCGEQPIGGLYPEPLWPGRLQEVIRDLEAGIGQLPHGITQRPEVLRRYFLDRVFQDGYRDHIRGPYAMMMTKSAGRIQSLATIREQVLKDIEDLISFMTAPVGHGIRRVTFPRTPEAAAMRAQDPFGGNSANPREEHFMRQFRRIGGDAGFTSLHGYEGHKAIAEAMGNQPVSTEGVSMNAPSQPQSPTSIALRQYELGQQLAMDDNRGGVQSGGDLAEKHESKPVEGQPSGLENMSTTQSRIPSPLEDQAFSAQLEEIESRGASRLANSSLSEVVPAGHNKGEVTSASAHSLRKQQLDLLRTASKHRSSAHEHRSSSQTTLIAQTKNIMDPYPYNHAGRQDVSLDTDYTDYIRHGDHSPTYHAAPSQDQRLPVDLVHSRMFNRSDWENYVSPLSAVQPAQMQSIPKTQPASVMHQNYDHDLSTAGLRQFDHEKFDLSSVDVPQSAVHGASWEDVYTQRPTSVLQQPYDTITSQAAYAGPSETSYDVAPQTPYAAPQSMQYGAQPMQHGFPQQSVSYAGSFTTDAGSSTAYEAPTPRYTYAPQGMMNQPMYSSTYDPFQGPSYVNVGVRAPAPNRVAAVLARSKEFENYAIPQSRGTPTPTQALRHHRVRGTPAPSQPFVHDDVHGYTGPGEAYNQVQPRGASISPQDLDQNLFRATPVPNAVYTQHQLRGSPAPHSAYIRNQGREGPVPTQIIPQYQVRGPPAALQAFPDSHVRSIRVPVQVPQNSYEWQSRFGIPQDIVKPDLPILHYRDGSDDMRPHHIQGVPTIAYQNLVRNLAPSYGVFTAAEHMPFAEIARETKPAQWGVLKISNIPYDINKNLVVSFLGNHAKLITPNFGPAIHIIMDRVSGKTMDCFVEFLSPLDARATCNSINLRQRGLIRISDRVVDVSMSSQNELLATLFPKAKDVNWVNGKPVIMQPEEEWSSGFKSFVSAEELGLLVKHAEQPHRSNYTQRSPQRCYEAMVSLLAKFPWHSVENYTLRQRNLIFNAARQMLHILSINIRKQHGRDRHSRAGSTLSYASSDKNPWTESYGGYGSGPNINPGSKSAESLTEELLKDLLSAGLNAAGFSENQHWQLYEACEYAKHHFVVSPILQYWPFEVLGRKLRVEEDVLELYALIIANNPEVEQTGFPFGSLHKLTARIDMEAQTMDKIGGMELKMLDALLAGGIDNALAHTDAEQGMGALTL